MKPKPALSHLTEAEGIVRRHEPYNAPLQINSTHCGVGNLRRGTCTQADIPLVNPGYLSASRPTFCIITQAITAECYKLKAQLVPAPEGQYTGNHGSTPAGCQHQCSTWSLASDGAHPARTVAPIGARSLREGSRDFLEERGLHEGRHWELLTRVFEEGFARSVQSYLGG